MHQIPVGTDKEIQNTYCHQSSLGLMGTGPVYCFSGD